MRCPDDGHQLAANKKERVTYHYCRHCDGLWFSGEAIKDSIRAVLPSSHDRKPAKQIETRVRACPQCETGLTAERFDEIVVDFCGTCGGVWLDPGEYSTARKLIKLRRMEREMPQFKATTNPLKRFIDQVIDVVGAFYIDRGIDRDDTFDAGRYIQKPSDIRRHQKRKPKN